MNAPTAGAGAGAVTEIERLWTVANVADYLQASTSYVYKCAERGEIPCRRLGALLRFVPADVRRWAEGGRPKPGAVLPLSRT
jgi:excisionase family DNA binding protein